MSTQAFPLEIPGNNDTFKYFKDYTCISKQDGEGWSSLGN